MFGNKSTPTDAPTVIGQGAVIEGNVRIDGRVQVDGEIEGTLVVQGHVSLGPNGKVRGELIADNVTVGGEVEGKVTAREHLHVVSTGIVRGDVRYATLQVDRGALLDGSTAHGDPNGEAKSDDKSGVDAAMPEKASKHAKDDGGKRDSKAKAPPVPPPAVGAHNKRPSQAPARMGAS